jgi:hypothetical protein
MVDDIGKQMLLDCISKLSSMAAVSILLGDHAVGAQAGRGDAPIVHLGGVEAAQGCGNSQREAERGRLRGGSTGKIVGEGEPRKKKRELASFHEALKGRNRGESLRLKQFVHTMSNFKRVVN